MGYYFYGYDHNYYYDATDKRLYSYRVYMDGTEYDTSDTISTDEELTYDEFIDRCEAIELAEELTRKKN